MATAVLIDLSNYDSLLLRSDNPRGSSPNGNIYFDTTNGEIQFLSSDDVANITYPANHPGYTDGNPEANPLDPDLGIKFEAIYAFENQERKSSLLPNNTYSEDLRMYDRWTSGTFKFGGAYNFINGRTPSTDGDRKIIRGSGWNEMTGTTVNRIYFGVKGLGSIDTDSQPYYQQVKFGTVTDFDKLGNIDEAVQVYGDASNGDFDYTLAPTYYQVLSIRKYGNNFDRVDTYNTLGINELGGYSTGAALNESAHLTTSEASYPIADVWGGAQTAPWTGMTLEKLVSAQNETGFADEGNGTSGNFTWVLNNTGAGSLYECVAYLDAIATVDGTVTTGESALNGKAVNVWYEYTADGKIRPITGADDGLGLFIEGLVGDDKQRVEFRDDDEIKRVYPVYVSITMDVGQGAVDDTQAWFHAYYAAAYNTSGAVTLTDSSATAIKGNVSSSPFRSGTNIVFEYDYTGNGSTPQNCVFLCEGDGGVTQQKTLFTITASSASFSCIPATETNV